MKNDRNATNLFRKVSLEQDKDLMVQEGDWVDSQYIRHRHLFDKLQQPLHRSGQGMELYCMKAKLNLNYSSIRMKNGTGSKLFIN